MILAQNPTLSTSVVALHFRPRPRTTMLPRNEKEQSASTPRGAQWSSRHRTASYKPHYHAQNNTLPFTHRPPKQKKVFGSTSGYLHCMYELTGPEDPAHTRVHGESLFPSSLLCPLCCAHSARSTCTAANSHFRKCRVTPNTRRHHRSRKKTEGGTSQREVVVRLIHRRKKTHASGMRAWRLVLPPRKPTRTLSKLSWACAEAHTGT